MSHIFISYSHQDKAILDRVVLWFQEDEKSKIDLWYDNQIEGGNNWRDEIAIALDSAYVVIVIVTNSSVKSVYCTYEWAYAMGQGIPILPLIFDNVDIASIPSPLATRQFINCTSSIPDYLREQTVQFESQSPQIAALNQKILDIIYDTHRRFYILGWMGEQIFHAFDEKYFKEDTFDYFVEQSGKARLELEQLILSSSLSMTARQYRYCWRFMDFLKEFSRLPRKIDSYFYTNLFAKFETDWLPAFRFFEQDGFWEKFRRRDFDMLEHSEQFFDYRLGVILEIARVFPHVVRDDIETLLEAKT